MSSLNKYKQNFHCLEIIHDKFLDFVLSHEDEPTIPLIGWFIGKCLVSFFDFGNRDTFVDRYALSSGLYTYENAVNNGCELLDIGLTGIDNGLIKYLKYEITNEEFLDILTNSRIDIEKDVYRMFMHPVTGNSLEYSYDYSVVDNEYVSLKGGFYQGFFKLHGFDYQVLPKTIEDEWNIEISVRPMDYETRNNTLNKTHPGNEGFIFYMGTRAENKFAQFYNSDFSDYEDRFPDFGGDKFGGYFGEDDDCKEKLCDFEGLDKNYFAEIDESCQDDDNYFADDYRMDCDGGFWEDGDGYYKDDIDLDGTKIVTSEGRGHDLKKYYEIETDNKFITHNRTCTGLTVHTEDECDGILLTGTTSTYKGNLFIDMNRTKSGYTVKNIEKLYELHEKNDKYNFTDDLINNSFGVRVRDDGSIGYKYTVKDCDNEKGFSVKEEYSFPGVVKKGEWNVINIKIKSLSGYSDECENNVGDRKMKIYIYINGYLKFVSHELPVFDFRELNETYEKQEGVPFSISVGGGTQGLCDSIWLDYYKPFNKILDIEKNYAGSFIGDLKTFKFYNCMLESHEIKNNAMNILNTTRKTI